MVENIDWITVERPGYLGKKRDEIEKSWDKKYGDGNWRLMYEWNPLIIPRREAIQIYEDAYYEYFKRYPQVLEWLVKTASDVYDTAITNVEAKFDYEKQETPNNHIHDVALRRAVLRNGRWFEGDHLMHVRGEKTEGARISPGVVSFHLPHMIVKGEIKDYGGKGIWWHNNTVEDFYQRNKLLQVRKT
ncbi:hypothetical protein HYX17_03840 [Candidatus Woesearchaeota archaeon]|nr:hypothetical protein [Candidatus Woesearchaeota archaeon]